MNMSSLDFSDVLHFERSKLKEGIIELKALKKTLNRMSNSDLKTKIEDFLLFGPCNTAKSKTNEESSEDLIEAKKCVTNIFSEYEAEEKMSQNLKEDASKLQEQASSFLSKLDNSEILSKFSSYKKLDFKIQHLLLAQRVTDLVKCSSGTEISEKVFEIVHAAPELVLQRSQIKIYLMETIKQKKVEMLPNFHQLVNSHLDSCQSNDNFNSNVDDTYWKQFFTEAGDQLKAFTLVSLLPTSLMESDNMVMEKYQETLDEALTPLWGRFHYHLEESRSTKSIEQLLWTFSYSKSFIEMIVKLCIQITSSGDLQRLRPIDYMEAALDHVINKATRFLRAHIAQIFVLFSPLTDGFCMRIVENVLELDDWMFKQSKSQSVIFSVVFESYEIFHQWIFLERSLFLNEVLRKCSQLEKIFLFPFGNEVSTFSNGNISRKRCYSGVYDTMILFFQAMERYQYFPKLAQDLISEIILEPLLVVSVGLFLYRIRSHKILYSISLGTYKNLNRQKLECPIELSEFIDSVQYFHLCLGSSTLRSFTALAPRFREKWNKIQSWTPKVFLIPALQKAGKSIENMIKLSFELPMKFDTNINEDPYYYRKHQNSGKLKLSAGENDTLGDCVDITRGLSITLSNVLQKQLKLS